MALIQLSSIIQNAAALDGIVQDNTLARMFHDSLYPQLLYRMEAYPEKWDAGQGDTKLFTRASLLTTDTDPLDPGLDPSPENENFEQWRVTANQYAKTTDVNMLVSRSTLANLFLRKAKTLGLNAGRTMNRIPRNRLFCAYATGHTIAETAAAPDDFFEVASIAGFQEQLDSTGQLNPVSASNPKTFSINGTTQTPTIIAATASDANFPSGRGVITTSADVTVAVDDTIRAADSAAIVRSGGGTSVDAIAATDLLTLADIRAAVAQLRTNNVPAHDDGYFHCHLDPTTEAQLFADTEFRQLNESNYGDAPYQMFAVGKLLGCIFYTNSESPREGNVGTLQVSRPVSSAAARLGKEIGAEVVNDVGVRILRTIITGGGALYENYIDESETISEAGIQGKIGGFSVVNNGIQITMDRIRYIVRAPQDRLQQQVAQTWSWAGDFGVPSDFLGEGGVGTARYKRAVVIESGNNAL